MPRVELTAESIGRELAAFRQNLSAGLEVLRGLGDVQIGATPRTVVMTMDGLVLYRYGVAPYKPDATPLLIVYALVNRPDMADLQKGRSLIGALLERGFDVYLIDWGYPTGADRLLGLDDYVNRYIDACVDHLRERLQRERLPLLGICQGGTLSTAYTALHPHKVERLVTTVTPIDFHTPSDRLSHLIREVDIDTLVASFGNVSGDFLNWLFLSLKPYRLTQQKYVRFLEQLSDPEATAMFLRMEQWIFDSPALAANACREFAQELYQRNKLVADELVLGGRTVELGAITVPVLNIYARDDHLVPPASSRALGPLLGTDDFSEVEIPGGHIGIYVGLKSPISVPAAVAAWMPSQG